MRQKLCYATHKEVAHIWANNPMLCGAIYSREKRTSVYCSGDTSTFYSYNTPIARFYSKEVVFLLSKRVYSNTTTKHQNALIDGTRHRNRIFVHDVRDARTTNIDDAKKEIVWLCEKQKRARSKSYENDIRFEIEQIEALVQTFELKAPFDLGIKDKSIDDIVAFFLNLSEEEKRAERERREKAAKEELKRIKSIQKELKNEADFIAQHNTRKIEAWRAGEKVQASYEDIARFYALDKKALSVNTQIDALKKGTFLRLSFDGDNVETSRGACIPVTVAKGLWRRLQRNESIDGMSLGRYTVGTLKDGILIVGCHQIPFGELEIIAQLLGLETLSA